MQNLLIVDHNILNIQRIVRNTSNVIFNIKLFDFYLANDKNIFKSINNNAVDIILINIEKEQIDILEYISKNNIEFYKKSIIVLYKDKNKLLNILKPIYEKYIFKCVKIDNEFKKLTKWLLELTSIKEKNYNNFILEIKLKKILTSMGFNCTHNGSKYIIEIIKYLYINNIKKLKLNVLFENLGKKYNKSPNTIKGNIRAATAYMYKNYNEKFLINYFNYIDLVKLPTVSEIISTILKQSNFY